MSSINTDPLSGADSASSNFNRSPLNAMDLNVALTPSSNSLELKKSVRVLETADLSEQMLGSMGEIYATCFRGPPWNEVWDTQAAIDLCRTFCKLGGITVVAEVGGIPVGLTIGFPLDRYVSANSFAEFQPPERCYYLAELAVLPTYRGLGLGEQLARTLVERAKASGSPEIFTRTRSDNGSAIRVFERCGFTRCGEVAAETGGVVSTRVILRRGLD